MTPVEAKRIMWLLSARDDQLPPTDAMWLAWWLRSGRGGGKTKTGGEWIADQARTYPRTKWTVVAPTQAACRDLCFQTGDSSLLESVIDPSELAEPFNKGELLITLKNGSLIKGFSAEKPDRLRGWQGHGGWLEEISSWDLSVKKKQAMNDSAIATLDMFEFGNRLPMPDGLPNRFVITSTPKKNHVTRQLSQDPRVHITTSSTYDNAENLNPQFLQRMLDKYEGTRLGQQELYGIVLEDAEGSLWKTEYFVTVEERRPYVRAAVGWDPAVTNKPTSDLHGIIGIVAMPSGSPVVAQVLADRSKRCSPVEGARLAIDLAREIGAPDVYCEDNQGKDTWLSVWREAGGRDSGVRLHLKSVSGSKKERAIPIATLFEQRRVEMCGEDLDLLEDECCSWEPDVTTDSPNRIDALGMAFRGANLIKNTSVQAAGRLSDLLG